MAAFAFASFDFWTFGALDTTRDIYVGQNEQYQIKHN